MTVPSRGYAAKEEKGVLGPFSFARRDIGPKDIMIDILYCGVCHSDIHQVNNDWGGSKYPLVPGHEIVGRVTKVGSSATKFKAGDIAGVGCLVDSCRACESCKNGEEQFCEKGPIWSYNSPEKQTGGRTRGGYSTNIVVDESFTLKIPPNSNLAATAPLLCAGVTTYSPLKRWKVAPGKKVGIIGLGGLGHMALKFAHSFGAHTVQFTTSPEKEKDALRLGADEVVVSTSKEAMERQLKSFDFILDTVSAQHDINQYLALLKTGGNLVTVGLPSQFSVQPFSLVSGRRSFSGSLIGGIKETQEMLDYCAKQGITSDVEIIPIQKINEAYVRTIKGDVKYRFVIDLASLKE